MPVAYSQRFVAGTDQILSYGVPAGKRAIVKCITAYNPNPSTGGVSLFIGDTPVLSRPVAAGTGLDLSGLHVVFYSGELVRLNVLGGLFGQASGYLLEA
jgi:hypothetical protein